MIMAERRIALLAAGTGTRLGAITAHRNKGLLSINNKAVLSYLIERLPRAPIVVALGHCGSQVRQFLEMAYPDRHFLFCEIDPYQGEGASSGYSLYSLRDLLPGPFIFCTNDMIVQNDIRFVGKNWVGVRASDDVEKYTRVSLFGDRVTRIYRKGEHGGSVAYSGLAEIHDVPAFWESLANALGKQGECSDIEGLFGLLGCNLYAKEIDWLDTGNKDQYDYAVQALGDHGAHLPKADEDLYFHQGRVIKFYADRQKCVNRVTRADILGGLVPKIERYSPNYYTYNWVAGEMLSASITPQRLLHFLNWAKVNLWLSGEPIVDDEARCRSFYVDKTLRRLCLLFSSGHLLDREYIINGLPCRRPAELLEMLGGSFYAGAQMVQFHGDLHPDNIIIKADKSGYVLLDWREDYAGLLASGDMYYDLAKLYHGLLMAHEYIKAGDFQVNIQGGEISIDFPVHYRNLNAIAMLEQWMKEHNLSIHRLHIIVALIYMNNAPLHHYPYNQLLFFLGNQLLQKELCGSHKSSL